MTLGQVYSNQNRTATQLTTSFDVEFDRVFARVVATAQARLGGMSETDILAYDLVWAEVLDEAGYYDLVDDYIDVSFDDVYDDTLKAFNTVGLSTAFTEDDLVKIQNLKTLHKEFFYKIGADIGLSVKKNLYSYAIAGASLAQITQNIRVDIEDSGLKRYASTYARTAITNYQQEVINTRSSDLDGVWIYEGVVDSKTRPFCRRLMNRGNFYTDSEKNKLENDSDREYNCRHRFYKVSKEWAKDNGYKG